MPTAGSPLPYHDHPFTEKGRGEVHQHRPEMSGRDREWVAATWRSACLGDLPSTVLSRRPGGPPSGRRDGTTRQPV